MSEEKTEVRALGFITWMQMIGCLLVIVGHSYPFVAPSPQWALKLRTFIYDFHMPLFIWCSGFLIIATRQAEKYAFLQYVRRRFVHLLIPYIVFSIIGIIPKVLLSSVLNDTLTFDFVAILRAFFVPRESIWGHFWFLPTIFTLGIIGYLLAIPKNKGIWKWIIYGVMIPLGIVGYFLPNTTDWFAINDVIHNLVYLVIGMLCAEWVFNFGKYKPLMGLGAMVTAVCLFIFLPHTNVLSFAISLLLLFAIWTLSIYLDEKRTVNRKAIYAQTYAIFILAWPCQLVVQLLMERVLHLSFAAVFPSMLVVGITAPLLIIYLVNLFERKTKKKILSRLIGM